MQNIESSIKDSLAQLRKDLLLTPTKPGTGDDLCYRLREGAEHVYPKLLDVAAKLHVPVKMVSTEEESDFSENAIGMASLRLLETGPECSIFLRKGLPLSTSAGTLAHELGHVICDHYSLARALYSSIFVSDGQREATVEAISYCVLRYYGAVQPSYHYLIASALTPERMQTIEKEVSRVAAIILRMAEEEDFTIPAPMTSAAEEFSYSNL